MRTFTVACPACDCDLDVEIEDADLLDTELGHLVTCADCQMETEYVYDADLDDLLPADEEDEDDDGVVGPAEDLEEDDDEDELP